MRLNKNVPPADFNSELPERKLWIAVLLQAVQDWRSANLRRQREADNFFFGGRTEFVAVCARAGIDAGSLRPKLERIRPIIPKPLERAPVFKWPLVSL